MPIPDDVRRDLSGLVDDQQLHRYLDGLHASGEWTVFSPLATAHGWVQQLFHNPTGTSMYLTSKQTGGSIWQLSVE